MRARSSRVLRDVGYEMYSVEDNWDDRQYGEAALVSLESEKRKQDNLPGTALVLSFIVGVVFFAFLSRNGTESGEAKPATKGKQIGMLESLVNKIPSGPPAISMRDDFYTGLSSWQGASKSSGGWSFDGGLIRPGELKIWKDSVSLTNYRLQFEGKIDHKGMSWAFRAPDLQNYYATKINLVGKGNGPLSAEIVRYMVTNGRASEREVLPIPLLMRNSDFFKVDVKVKENRFTTSIDGHIVDIWQDGKFQTGGVGFFNEKGELSSLKWVALSEADTFVDKMKSLLYLSYILPPPAW